MSAFLPADDATYTAKTVAYTTVGSTGTWPAGPADVLVWCTTAAYIKVGEGATATTSSTPLPANTPMVFAVPPGTGGAWRVSAVQVAAGGNCYAKPGVLVR